MKTKIPFYLKRWNWEPNSKPIAATVTYFAFLVWKHCEKSVLDKWKSVNKCLWPNVILRLFQSIKTNLSYQPIDRFRPTETPSFLGKSFQAIWLFITLPNVNWTCSTKSEEFDNVSMKLLLTIYFKREAVSINMVMNSLHPWNVNLMGKNGGLISWVESAGQRTDQ